MKYLKTSSHILSSRLSTLIYFVTNSCNQGCKTCYNHAALNKNITEELSLEEIEKVCRKLRSLLLLQCSGGEPFLKKSFYGALSAFARISSAITIPTNATFPQRVEDTVARLVSENKNTLFRVALSLDGLEDLHDKIRDLEGSFTLWMDTFQRIKKIRQRHNNLLIIANTVLNKANEQDIFRIVDFVHGLGVDHHTITYIWGDPLQGTLGNPSIELYKKVIAYQDNKNYDKNRRNSSAMFMRAVNRTADEIMLQMLEEQKYVQPCKATRKFVIMLPNGEIKPCHLKSDKLGNVRDFDYDIPRILRQEKTKGLARDIRTQKCWCTVQCNNRNNVLYNTKNFGQLAVNAARHRLNPAASTH